MVFAATLTLCPASSVRRSPKPQPRAERSGLLLGWWTPILAGSVIFHVTSNRRIEFGALRVVGAPPKQAGHQEAALHSYCARLQGASFKLGKPCSPERLQLDRLLPGP
jgi:hypothetical protein